MLPQIVRKKIWIILISTIICTPGPIEADSCKEPYMPFEFFDCFSLPIIVMDKNAMENMAIGGRVCYGKIQNGFEGFDEFFCTLNIFFPLFSVNNKPVVRDNPEHRNSSGDKSSSDWIFYFCHVSMWVVILHGVWIADRESK